MLYIHAPWANIWPHNQWWDFHHTLLKYMYVHCLNNGVRTRVGLFDT